MHASAQACSSEERIGRRIGARHRLDLSGRLVAPGMSLRVQLEDISATGARIHLMQPRLCESAQLRWLGFAVFGQVAWRKDMRCGLMFEEPLSQDWLDRTIEFAGLISSHPADKYGRLASAWVHGPGDW